MNSDDLIAWALAEAQSLGPETEPQELLALVAGSTEPLSSISDTDRANKYFEQVRVSFGFLEVCRRTHSPPTLEHRDRLVGLMRWLVREFTEWRSGNDSRYYTLTALSVVTRYCELHGAFWTAFPNGLEKNVELVQELGKILTKFNIDLIADEISRSPVSDGETIDAFKKADAEGKWAEIAARWNQLVDFMPPNVFLSQAVMCLHRFNPDELTKTANKIEGMLRAAQVLSPLNIEEGLALALKSENPYFEFAATLRSLARQSRTEVTETGIQNLLTKMLCKVSADGPRWKAWMEVFNKYPIRYPALQVPLGSALAEAPDYALDAYINAVSLSNMAGDSRRMVGNCLLAFRSVASPERRQKLWTLAYERWSKWNFGVDDPLQGRLIRVSYSELDYAVVGYVFECISDADRANEWHRIVDAILSLPDIWHASHVDFLTASYCLLSRLQPFAFAATVVSTQDWLSKGSYSLPFDPATRRYEAMIYGFQ